MQYRQFWVTELRKLIWHLCHFPGDGNPALELGLGRAMPQWFWWDVCMEVSDSEGCQAWLGWDCRAGTVLTLLESGGKDLQSWVRGAESRIKQERLCRHCLGCRALMVLTGDCLLKSEPPGQKGLKVISAVLNGGSVCL